MSGCQWVFLDKASMIAYSIFIGRGKSSTLTSAYGRTTGLSSFL
jgi:hypothetical protein